MTLRPESKWTGSLIQVAAMISAITAGVWYVRGTYEDVIRGQAEIKSQIAEIQRALDSKYVTQDHADRYASAFRWENRELPLVVPDPKSFR